MKEWLINNWQFLVKEAIVPIVTFVIGLFSGIKIERKSKKKQIKNQRKWKYRYTGYRSQL